MKRLSLVARLNLWYAAVLLITVFIGLLGAELTSSWLGRQRQVALVERVEREVRTLYREGGREAISVVTRGVHTELSDREPPRSTTGFVETTTRLDKDVWLHLSIPDEVVQRTRREARLGLLGGGGLALLVALIGGTWVTRRALRPIEDVAQTAHRILSHGDTGERVPSPQTGDQLDRMVGLFNSLLDSNQNMVQAMHHSLDSIGHDLRTPLTRIRSSAELALDGTTSAKDEALETALEESAAIDGLLGSLLDLSRAEAGMLPLDLQPLSLVDTATRILTLYEHVASERNIRLQLDAPADIEVYADPNRTRQALANLVDNALKFSGEGSEVRLGLVEDTAQGLAGVTVHDQGPGIPAEELPRVFERLYRGDRSRSTPGSGLGLSMVRAIAEAHGGRVDLDSTAGQGTRVSLWLPLSPPPSA